MLCKDCHAATGCQVIHPDVVTAKCDGCGKETLCVDCQIVTCVDLRKILEDLTKNMHEVFSHKVTNEELAAAMERYPGLPIPVAVTRYMLDMFNEQGIPLNLHKGLGWGGVHLERVGFMVQQLADAMYHQAKESITIKLKCEGYPESWDHIWLEIMDVQGGDKTDEAKPPKEA